MTAATVSGKIELKDSRDPSAQKGRDYSGVVVSLVPLSGYAPPAAKRDRATIRQKDKTFTPHVLAIQAGSTVHFPNFDPIFHNAFSSYSGQIFDIGLYPPGTDREVRFTRPGVVRVFCNIHAAMSAVIVVLNTPYYAVTKENGWFEIADAPPGEYELSVFHERAMPGALDKMKRRIVVEDGALVVPPLAISEAGYLPVPHKNKFGRDYPPDAGDLPLYPGKGK